jgi:hypothetical protein
MDAVMAIDRKLVAKPGERVPRRYGIDLDV